MYDGGDCCDDNARGRQGLLGPGSVDECCCSWDSDHGVHFGGVADQWSIARERRIDVSSPLLQSATCIASAVAYR